MAMYDWVPYLEGKYLSYYQWFAFIAGFVMLVLSLLSFLAYLVLCYLAQAAKQSLPFLNTLKSITFNGGFIFLAIIPLVCSAVDTIYLVEGMLGMMLILTGMILIDNGRRNWQPKQLQ